ncbi:MAG: hypothetical protein AAF633_25045 [Chloroflexota bacterium]
MTTRQLFSFILLAAIFALSIRISNDPDLWWHLQTGQYILDEGIPYQDPGFSFTADGYKWVTHEWLSQVFMIGVNNWLGGLTGLSMVFAGIITLTYGLLYYSSDGRPYIAGLVTLWGVLAAAPAFNVRPQMFNILFGAVIIFIVEGVKKRGWSPHLQWLIVPLIGLWANMHGGYILGIVIVGVYVVGEAAQLYFQGGHEEGLSYPAIGILAGSGALGFLAAALNPNTYEIWIYAFETLTSDAMREIIAEWKSPNFHFWLFWFFGFMMFATWGVMIYSKRPVLWTDTLFVVGTSFAALQSGRNISLFVMVAIPIMSRHLVGIFQDREFGKRINSPEPYTPNNIRLLNIFVSIGMMGFVLYYAINALAITDEILREDYPVEAVRYIQAEGIDEARFYNDYEWGGYLIREGMAVFVDGRADVYGDELLYDYLTIARRQPEWREPLDRFDVEYVLTRSNGGLAVFMEAIPEFELLYADETAQIYQRVEE